MVAVTFLNALLIFVSEGVFFVVLDSKICKIAKISYIS